MTGPEKTSALDDLLATLPPEGRESILKLSHRAHLQPDDPFLVALVTIRQHDQELARVLADHSTAVQEFSKKLLSKAESAEKSSNAAKDQVQESHQLLHAVSENVERLRSIKLGNLLIFIGLTFLAGMSAGFYLKSFFIK